MIKWYIVKLPSMPFLLFKILLIIVVLILKDVYAEREDEIFSFGLFTSFALLNYFT